MFVACCVRPLSDELGAVVPQLVETQRHCFHPTTLSPEARDSEGACQTRRMTYETPPNSPAVFQRRLDALQRACRDTEGVSSLVVFGSSTRRGAARRDEWSDIDFNLFVTDDERGRDVRRSWDFLPDRDEVVLAAREGENGGVALYRDGLVCEFGVGSPWEIRDPDREVLLDGGDLRFSEPPELAGALDQLGLFVVKLLIGYGRVCRGEVLAGNASLRCGAVLCLAEALRQRLVPETTRSPFDPLRRLERTLPDIAAEIAGLQLAPARECAEGLLDLAERELAPGWQEFPREAFEVARAVIGRA